MRTKTELLALLPAGLETVFLESHPTYDGRVMEVFEAFDIPITPDEAKLLVSTKRYGEYEFNTMWNAQHLLNIQVSAQKLDKIRQQFLNASVQSFVLEGYGSGDSTEGYDLTEGEDPSPLFPSEERDGWNSYGILDKLESLAWNISGADYNNEGGGWTLRWDSTTQKFSIEGYANVSSREDISSWEG